MCDFGKSCTCEDVSEQLVRGLYLSTPLWTLGLLCKWTLLSLLFPPASSSLTAPAERDPLKFHEEWIINGIRILQPGDSWVLNVLSFTVKWAIKLAPGCRFLTTRVQEVYRTWGVLWEHDTSMVCVCLWPTTPINR